MALKAIIVVIIWTVGLITSPSSAVRAQSTAVPVAHEDLASKYLEDVEIEAESVSEVLSTLSFSYDVPIGFQVSENCRDRTVYPLRFKKVALKDLLEKFFAGQDQYEWEITDGVVNVFPKMICSNPMFDELLETEIDSVSVTTQASCWEIQNSLVRAPPIQRVLEMRGLNYHAWPLGGFYIQNVGNTTLDLKHMTLKAALNKIVKESRRAKFWRLAGNGTYQTVTLILSARFSDKPDKLRFDLRPDERLLEP